MMVSREIRARKLELGGASKGRECFSGKNQNTHVCMETKKIDPFNLNPHTKWNFISAVIKDSTHQYDTSPLALMLRSFR